GVRPAEPAALPDGAVDPDLLACQSDGVVQPAAPGVRHQRSDPGQPGVLLIGPAPWTPLPPGGGGSGSPSPLAGEGRGGGDRMRPRVLLEAHHAASYEQILAFAQTAEEAGFEGFFRSDHYLGIERNNPRFAPTDSWTTLAGLARETRRVRLGTLVTASTFRLPGVLAITVAPVDALSGGRVELGLGAAWYTQEHEMFGIPFPPIKERFDRLEEQLSIVTGLWTTPPG